MNKISDLQRVIMQKSCPEYLDLTEEDWDVFYKFMRENQDNFPIQFKQVMHKFENNEYHRIAISAGKL